jgi:hypothetical protein
MQLNCGSLLRRTAILSVFVLLSACDEATLPSYWLCQGTSSQKVEAVNQASVEYRGADPVLLEVFQGHVYQFFSPAMAGAYRQCPSQQADRMLFRMTDCQEQGQQSYFRQGELNLQTGQLQFSETRYGKEFSVTGAGQYQCQFIGHTYEFTPFNHVKKSP